MPYVSPKSSSSSSTSTSTSTSSTSNSNHTSPPLTLPASSPSLPQPMSDDLLTPRPNTIDPSSEITTALSQTHLTSSHPGSPPAPPRDTNHPLPTEMTNSTSTTSLTSLSTTASSISPSDGITTPPTSSGTPDALDPTEVQVAGSDDRVARYKQDLYAYTRELYLQAKLSQKRKSGQAGYAQFGLKQSGMERMAAKKALAKKLNG